VSVHAAVGVADAPGAKLKALTRGVEMLNAGLSTFQTELGQLSVVCALAHGTSLPHLAKRNGTRKIKINTRETRQPFPFILVTSSIPFIYHCLLILAQRYFPT
jgi:hypothetical protein